jgi:prepilin-type processing-associated H-X9-DG protein
MKPRFSIYEVLFGIVVLLLVVALLLPRIAQNHDKNGIIYCMMNIRQINIAYISWAHDHGERFPMEVSVTNGGAMELVAKGNVATCFIVISNQLGSPKVLICPNDLRHIAATNFGADFNNSHISYFADLDASKDPPRGLLVGDANFAIHGVPVGSGILELSSNLPVAWTLNRHPHGGTVGFVDGHAQEVVNSVLPEMLQQFDAVNNRLAIP